MTWVTDWAATTEDHRRSWGEPMMGGGLAICKRFAVANGGPISAHSKAAEFKSNYTYRLGKTGDN